MSEDPNDNQPIQQNVEHGPWFPLDEDERSRRARDIFKATGYFPDKEDPIVDEEAQLHEHKTSISNAFFEDSIDDNSYTELRAGVDKKLFDIQKEYKQRAKDPRFEPSLEQKFELFDHNQKEFASGMLDYVFGLYQDKIKAASRLYNNYYGNTSKHTYLEDSESQPVLDWVADKIDEAFLEGSRATDINPDTNPDGERGAQDAQLALLESAYARYDLLANFTGHGPNEDTFIRIYPVMRNLFRSAGTIANLRDDQELLEKWQGRWNNLTNRSQEYRRYVAHFEPEYQTREELYFEFRDQPERQDIWEEVEGGILVAESYGDNQGYGDLAKVPGQALIDLGRRIRNALPEDYWDILAETSPTGESWVDTLPHIKYDTSKHGIWAFIDMLLPNDEYDPASDSKRWETAVEIGAKSGSLTQHLLGKPVAQRHTVIEPNGPLLGLARAKLDEHMDSVGLIQSDMIQLPLADDSVELVVGDQTLGSTHEVGRESALREVSRVLKTGGIIYRWSQKS